MALLRFEGFSNIGNGQQAIKGYTGSAQYAPTAGRNGRGRATTGASAAACVWTLPASVPTIVMGAAFLNGAGLGAVRQVFELREGATAHISVVQNASGAFEVRRGTSSGTVLGTTAATYTVGAYYFIEIKATIHDTTGSYELKIEGASVLTGTSVDTRNGGTSGVIDTVALSSFSNVSWSDWYILDTTGSAPFNNFLGDVRVDGLQPNAAGDSTTWTRAGTNTGNNWDQVNENAPDSDTTRVESIVVGNVDLYHLTDLPAGVNPLAVHTLVHWSKTDVGARSARTKLKQNSVTVNGTTTALGAGYVGLVEGPYLTAPDGSAWSAAKVNALQIGIEDVA